MNYFQRRKSKKARVEKTEVEIEAPLDDAIFAAMEEDETVEKIQLESECFFTIKLIEYLEFRQAENQSSGGKKKTSV